MSTCFSSSSNVLFTGPEEKERLLNQRLDSVLYELFVCDNTGKKKNISPEEIEAKLKSRVAALFDHLSAGSDEEKPLEKEKPSDQGVKQSAVLPFTLVIRNGKVSRKRREAFNSSCSASKPAVDQVRRKQKNALINYALEFPVS